MRGAPCAWLLACGALLGAASPLQAGTDSRLEAAPARIAIVVGNAGYASVEPLPNARRDAEHVAGLLDELGYSVFKGIDLDRLGFEELLREAMLNIPDGAEVVFYYAGHGLQIGARNYLLPTDAELNAPDELPAYAITLDRVIDNLAARGALHVAIIDACRNNPFFGQRFANSRDATLYETRSGFEPFRTPLNSLVAFATSPGTEAWEGDIDGNSPYTAALVSQVRAGPDSEVMAVLSKVRQEVYRSTGGAQVPWESSTLIAPFAFGGAGASLYLAAAGAEPDPAAPAAQEPAEADSVPGPDAPALPASEQPAVGIAAADPGHADAGHIEAPRIATRSARRELELAVPLDRFIRLDDQLAALFGADPSDRTAATLLAPQLIEPPRNGQLGMFEDGYIYYRPTLREIAAKDAQDFQITDRLVIEAGPQDARAQVSVELRLTPTPCDLLAGDRLDLQGVGLYRYPNEIDAEAAGAACTAAIAAAPDVPRFRFQLGRALLAAADYDAAFASFSAAAEAGHIRAMGSSASLLASARIDRGLSAIPLDLERAETLWRSAIAAGDPYAMHQLGRRLLVDASGDQARLQEGFELVDRASELGHTFSMNQLGGYYSNEETAEYQPGRARAYFTASALRGDIYGIQGLGRMALEGHDGAAADPSGALAYFEAAAEGGHPSAPGSIGRLYAGEQLGPPDYAQALEWYDIGLARGDAGAGNRAAQLITAQGIAGFDEVDALIRAAKAGALGAGSSRDYAAGFVARRPAATIDRALQRLMIGLGAQVSEDGKIGRQTLSALEALSGRAGLSGAVPADPAERLFYAARVHWAMHPIRVDLF